MAGNQPARIPLVLLPTPLHRLDRASESLDVDLWIKRDDLTGFALGGNKGRKLEYLLAAALAEGADTVLTCGSIQSNFVRQLAAGCAVLGLECVAVLMALPYEDEPPSGIALDRKGGNAFLNRIFGVRTIVVEDGTWEKLYRETDRVAKDLVASGKKLYNIPVGGSSALGAFAFYQAAKEVIQEEGVFDWIVACTSSGSTQTGLAYGFRQLSTRVLGISADPEPEMCDDLEDLGVRLAKLLEVPPIPAKEFLIDLNYTGSGYGVTDAYTLSTIEWLARMEGILLDPIYSGKAFRGLIDLVKKGTIGGKILFWHTGGIPTLFTLQQELQ